jgi:hypothetical protein
MTSGTSIPFNSMSAVAAQPMGSLGSQMPSSWNRSASELAASNIKKSSSVTASFMGPPSAAAQALLGQRTDLSGLLTSGIPANRGTTTSSQRLTSKIDPFAPNSQYGIEKSFDNHRDGILERILNKQRDQTERMIERMVEKRMEEDWKREREWWKKELVGNRNLVDPSNRYGSAGNGPHGAGNQGLLMNDAARTVSFAQDCDPKIVKDHLDIVCEIGKSKDVFRFLDKFEKLALMQGNVAGYQTAWLLLREVLPNLRTPVDGARATLTHLCRQYQGYIGNRVRSASLKGQDISTTLSYSNGLSGSIASYVKLITGTNGATVWDVLYYCELQ